MENKILYLSQEDVKKCLTVKDSVMAVEEGIRLLGEGKAIQPPKIYMEIGKYGGFMKPMIAFIDEPLSVSATKNFGFFPANREHGMSTVLATIILNDPKTGAPFGIMDGTWITALRTAATTAVAAKYLAKSDSKVVGIFGAGIQGRSHLMALNELFKLEKVTIADKSKEYRVRFAEEMSEKLNLDITPEDCNEQVVKGADIVITATTGNEPLVKTEWVEPGMFVAKVGSFQELDFGILKVVDKLVVDYWEYVSHRVPEITKTSTRRENVYAEIAEIVSGKKRGRENIREKILFLSIGMGVEDASVALLAYKRAKMLGIGQNLRL
jgi:ornithine cyclodeaminase/alanine dehydrogenase-like protein (mu-crystallin family)